MENENKNMTIWNKVCSPPNSALKTIGAGRLKGMSDINPQWRIQVLTETFGACGQGWTYDIVKTWTKEFSNGEVMVFAKVNLRILTEGAWHEIPGIGGSRLVTLESRGLYYSDEGYKMAVTDAIGVAAKFLGVGADIYLGGKGRPDSKYIQPPGEPAKVEKVTPFTKKTKEPEPELEEYSGKVTKITKQDLGGYNEYKIYSGKEMFTTDLHEHALQAKKAKDLGCEIYVFHQKGVIQTLETSADEKVEQVLDTLEGEVM